MSEEAEDGGVVFRAPDDYAEEEEEVGLLNDVCRGVPVG